MKMLEHQKDLYQKLIRNESFHKEADVLKTIFRNSICWVTEEGKKISQVIPGRPRYTVCTQRHYRKGVCEKKLQHLLKKIRKTKKPIRFNCDNTKFGMCLPIIQGDRIYGYIIICHSENGIRDNTISLFTNFIDTLIRELQKEQELTKLYKIIRPRAVALSTIHTIHRIISATLNLDELLPKLARLCLQVFRIKTCCIILRSHRKKPLSIKIVSKDDKNKSSLFYNKLLVKTLNRGQVLSNGKILMNKNKICGPLINEDIIGAIYLMDKIDGAPFDEFDREILMTLSEQAAIAIKNAQLYQEQENITIGSIKSLAAVLDTHDPGTYRGKESFIKITLAIGKELNLSVEDLRSLHYATILHDAGQIAFPDKLRKKSNKLTGKEYRIIKRHPHKSVSIIKHLDFLKPVVPIILHHHENYDGSGYPKGLKGERIPLGARIMAVAGAFTAMITKRPYRRKVDVQSAIKEIKKNSGTQFDPHVVKIFLKVIQSGEIEMLLKKGL